MPAIQPTRAAAEPPQTSQFGSDDDEPVVIHPPTTSFRPPQAPALAPAPAAAPAAAAAAGAAAPVDELAAIGPPGPQLDIGGWHGWPLAAANWAFDERRHLPKALDVVEEAEAGA